MNSHTLDYRAKEQHIVLQLKRIIESGGPVAVDKRTTNLFRARKPVVGQKLNFKNLNQVINIDTKSRIAEVEAATTFKALVDETLKHGLMPAVVPQFTTITVGGAVSGGACEASSFKYGAVHETITEMTILLSDGQVVTATPTNNYKDLFFAIPNTFGSLGYILKLKIKLVPVLPFVELQHVHFIDADEYVAAITEIVETKQYKGKTVDFLDGVIFSNDDLRLTIARFISEAPYTSNYTYLHIYYKSIRSRNTDYLTARDFTWRWDADWAWGSKFFGMQNPVLRLLLGKLVLNSSAYWKLVGLDRRFKIAKKMSVFMRGATPKESMVQDVEVPISRSSEYLDFFLKNFDLRPVWVCPLKSSYTGAFPFSGLDPTEYYINFGFWGEVSSEASLQPNHYNRLLETSVTAYNGHKALYSTNFYPQDEFWEMFDKKHYSALKNKYDLQSRLKDFYQKVCKEQV